MKPIILRDVMNSAPQTIEADQPLSRAHRTMREARIRHLPVTRGGQLVGLLSERDLHLMETLRDIDPAQVPVEDAMSTPPCALAATRPILDAIQEMQERKLGSVVVTEDDRIIGIFTAVDAMSLLFALLMEAENRPN